MAMSSNSRVARADLCAVVSVVVALVSGACLAADTDQDGTTEQRATGAPVEVGKIVVESDAASLTGALQGQEGVRIQTMCTHCNSANIQVGGLSADLVPISFGGFPLFGGLATTFVMNMLPSDSVAEAQITRGPGDALDAASAAGGTIDLTPADPRELPWADAIVDFGTFNRRTTTLRIAGTVASWLSGSIVAGRETVDLVDADGDSVTDVAEVDRDILDVRAIFKPVRSHRIELGYSRIKEEDRDGRGAFDEIRLRPDGAFTGTWFKEDDDLTRDEYRAGWEWRTPTLGTLTARGLSAERNQLIATQDRTFAGLTPLFDKYRIEERNRWATLTYAQPIGLEWRVTGGIEITREKVEAVERGQDGLALQNSIDKTDTDSVFLTAEYTPSSKWDILAGLRYDEVTLSGRTTRPNRNPETTGGDFEESSYAPRVTVRYRPAPDWTLRLVGGKTIRGPRSAFAEVCCGRAYISNAESGVRTETATTFAFEGLYQPSPTFKTSVYLARTEFDDYIQSVVADSFVFRQAYANANIPSVRAETAELVAQWSPVPVLKLDGSIGWLSMFNAGERLVEVTYVPQPSGVFPVTNTIAVDRIPYRPLRSASAGVSITFPGQVVFSATSSYTGPQLIQQWFLSLDRETPRPIGGFWMSNLSVSGPLGKYLEFSAGVDNVGNRVQSDLWDPTRDYNWGPLTGRSYRVGLRARLPR